LVDLSNSGFKQTQYNNAGYSIGNLKNIGYTSTNYKLAGYTPVDLINSKLYTMNDLLAIGYTYADIIPSGAVKIPGFIFDISSSVWSSLNIVSRIPIMNTSNSFSDLSCSYVTNATNRLTTVFITWTSYLYISNTDGLSFGVTGVYNSNNTSSINILQFDGIPLGTTNISTFNNYYGSITATDTPSILTNTVTALFYYSNCKNYGNIANWDMSNVTNATSMFEGSNFNMDISGWNVSNIKNFSNMFYRTNFNQPLNNWNVSNATSFSYMFFANPMFNQPLNNWNVSNCTYFSGMFQSATAFNQDITMWKFSANNTAVYVKGMFWYASSFNYNVGIWDYTHIPHSDGWVNWNMDYSFLGSTGYNAVQLGVLFISLGNNASFLQLLKNANYYNDVFPIQNILCIETPLTILAQSKLSNRIGTKKISSVNFKSSGYSTSDLRIVGYTIPQLLTPYPIGPGYILSDLSNSGFLKTDYAAIPYTIYDLSNARFSVDNL
jgi:hypothetical protein